MNALVDHIVSGESFFTGAALCIAAALVSRSRRPRLRRCTGLLFLIGLLAVTVSSTAIPYGYYGLTGAITLAWCASRYVVRWRRWSAWAMAVAWSVAVAIEVPYHLVPTLHPAPARSITVIGDSITAGVGDMRLETWPRVLAREHHLMVRDWSSPGDTTASALKRIRGRKIDSPVVILEIGGNDLLGTTSPAAFRDALDALLARVSAPGRQVLLFELPLPPFYHEIGRIQRELARKHGALLIPKRVLLSVLRGDGATLDTIHLSRPGHRRMAERVWSIVEGAFESSSAGP